QAFRQARVVKGSGAVAGQPGVAQVDATGPVGNGTAVREAGTPIVRVRVAVDVRTGSWCEQRGLGIVEANHDVAPGNRDGGLALSGLVGLVDVFPGVVDPDVANGRRLGFGLRNGRRKGNASSG